MMEKQTQQQVPLIQKALESNWQEYYQLLIQLPEEYFLSASLQLLNTADQLLNQEFDFSSANLMQRNLVAGIKDNQVFSHYQIDHLLLGDMQNFASYKKLIKNAPEALDKLFRIIPTRGPIDGWHYMQFIDSYQQLFFEQGFKQPHLFPATRLLSMKRPDQFIPLTQSSCHSLCQHFSIKTLKNQEFQRYWDDLITPIQKTSWYLEEQVSAEQTPIYRSRVALLEKLLLTPEPLDIPEKPIEQNEVQAKAVEIVRPIPKDDSNFQFSSNREVPDKQPRVAKKVTTQPKKMTISKRQSAKVNKNAATKLMSQYYFANKDKLSKLDIKASREIIIAKLIEGESVEKAFEEALLSVK